MNRDVPRTRSRLDAYIDGELGPRRQRRFERHLERCTQCRAELESVRELRDTMRSRGPVPGVPDPDVFREQILDRISRSGRAAEPSRPFPLSRALPHAAWAVPILAIGLWFAASRTILAPARVAITQSVQIELVNPRIVPMIDVREDGIPVVWLTGNSNEAEPPPPG